MTNVAFASLGCALVLAGLVCMVAGRRAIRRGRTQRHRNLMVAALAAHTLFVPVFVYRFVVFGFTPFDGPPFARPLYAFVLYTHEPMAVVSIPLAAVTLVLGIGGNVEQHVQLAGTAYRIWAYASLTGVVLYALLYL